MKLHLLVLSFSFVTVSASAQIERKPVAIQADSSSTYNTNNNADKQSRKERFKELDLSREQKGKLKEIMQSGKAAKEAIENDEKLSDAEKKKQLQQLKKSQLEKIEAILTPEQIEKFKASRQSNP